MVICNICNSTRKHHLYLIDMLVTELLRGRKLLHYPRHWIALLSIHVGSIKVLTYCQVS